jgi:HEAT repeat protein
VSGPAPQAPGNAMANAMQASKGKPGMPDKGAKSSAESVKEAKKGLAAANPEKAIDAVSNLAKCLDDPDKALAKQAAEALINEAKTNKLPEVRTAAIGALSAKADQFADVLIALTRNDNPRAQAAAIGALVRSKPGSKGEARLVELTQDPRPEIKRIAVTTLMSLRAGAGSNEIVALIAELGNPEGDASAQAAINIKIKGRPAVPYLADVIKKSPNARQRHAAAMCVALICAGTNPAQERFGAAAHVTKKGLFNPEKCDPAGVPILIGALSDTEPMVREIAAQGLGYLGDVRACPPLAKALRDTDVHVRRRAAAALVTLPAKSIQPSIEEAALKDPDVRVRRFAVEALGWIGDDSVSEPLARAAADRAAEVRRYAAMQLGRLAPTLSKGPHSLTAMDALVKLFKDSDEDVRWAAVQAVAALHDKRAAQYLVAALDDPVPQVSNAAEAGLQKLGIASQRMPGAAQ